MWEKTYVLITFVGAVLMIIGMTAFICAMLFTHKKRQSAYEQEELRVRIEVQEATVEQISRELHDNVGHELTLAKLQIKNVALEAGGTVEERLSSVLEILTRSLIMLRDISKSLSLDLIRTEGLKLAIVKQLERLKNASKYDIQFNVNGSYEYMSEKTELVVFRIFQEAISNIVRHSNAFWVCVTLECSTKCLCLIVRDNGVGFDVGEFTKGGHGNRHIGGLKNMHTRAAMIHANFNIESEVGKGTEVKVSVPLNNNTSSNE